DEIKAAAVAGQQGQLRGAVRAAGQFAGNQQVNPSVVVDVGGGERANLAVDGERHTVHEPAGGAVVEDDQSAVAGDGQVEPAVAVEVADCLRLGVDLRLIEALQAQAAGRAAELHVHAEQPGRD